MDERRIVPRCTDIEVTIHQCVVTHLGKETWLSATAGDISSHGLSLLLTDSINAGEHVYLLATVKPDELPARELSVNGVTTHCRPDGGQWRVGLEFIDLSPEDKAEWDAFLGC